MVHDGLRLPPGLRSSGCRPHPGCLEDTWELGGGSPPSVVRRDLFGRRGVETVSSATVTTDLSRVSIDTLRTVTRVEANTSDVSVLSFMTCRPSEGFRPGPGRGSFSGCRSRKDKGTAGERRRKTYPRVPRVLSYFRYTSHGPCWSAGQCPLHSTNRGTHPGPFQCDRERNLSPPERRRVSRDPTWPVSGTTTTSANGRTPRGGPVPHSVTPDGS